MTGSPRQKRRHLTDFVLTPGLFAAPGVHIGRAPGLDGFAAGHGMAPARLAGRTLTHYCAAPLLAGLAGRLVRLAGVLGLSASMLARSALELASSALVLSCVAPALARFALEHSRFALVRSGVAPVLARFTLKLSCSALGRFGAAPGLASLARVLYRPPVGLVARAPAVAGAAPEHACPAPAKIAGACVRVDLAAFSGSRISP